MLVSRFEKLFLALNTAFLCLISATMLLPIIHLLALSLSSGNAIVLGEVYFWPREINAYAYEYIASQGRIWRALGVSIYITAMGTAISLFLTVTLSFSLSRAYMPFRGLILRLILLTFIFSIPLIPYFLVVRNVGMVNTLWSLMVPSALGAYYVFIMKTFFQRLPGELFDAGQIDGCSEYGLLWRITVPMSYPVIATIGLFQAVYLWNSYFNAVIFIRDSKLYPIQMLVRELVIRDNLVGNLDSYQTVSESVVPEQLKAGITLFATLPIVLVYPFLQKYFERGAMLGSLKE